MDKKNVSFYENPKTLLEEKQKKMLKKSSNNCGKMENISCVQSNHERFHLSIVMQIAMKVKSAAYLFLTIYQIKLVVSFAKRKRLSSIVHHK